ncbi:unnamed protein product [Diplocarpon coronariae]
MFKSPQNQTRHGPKLDSKWVQGGLEGAVSGALASGREGGSTEIANLNPSPRSNPLSGQTSSGVKVDGSRWLNPLQRTPKYSTGGILPSRLAALANLTSLHSTTHHAPHNDTDSPDHRPVAKRYAGDRCPSPEPAVERGRETSAAQIHDPSCWSTASDVYVATTEGLPSTVCCGESGAAPVKPNTLRGAHGPYEAGSTDQYLVGGTVDDLGEQLGTVLDIA